MSNWTGKCGGRSSRRKVKERLIYPSRGRDHCQWRDHAEGIVIFQWISNSETTQKLDDFHGFPSIHDLATLCRKEIPSHCSHDDVLCDYIWSSFDCRSCSRIWFRIYLCSLGKSGIFLRHLQWIVLSRIIRDLNLKVMSRRFQRNDEHSDRDECREIGIVKGKQTSWVNWRNNEK
jgi:hypothetical protein